jgi:hypothetical protein
MSDYREVQHGFDLLRTFFDEARTKEFATAVDVCAPGAAMDAINLFNGWWQNHLNLNIYVASPSEHDRKEDTHGRLSMWRAFGVNSTRVAVIIKVPLYTGAAQALGIMFSPVAYLTEPEVHDVIREVIQNVVREAEFLKTLDRQTIIVHIFYMLLAGIACLKHQGFEEGREWRAIYTPQVHPSPMMEQCIEVVGGVPQHIHRVPLDRNVSPDIATLDLFQILDRIIIGPSPYPWVLYQAFVDLLHRAEVPDAAGRVFVSDIPIRY